MVTIFSRYPLLFQILTEQKLYSEGFNQYLNQVHDLADSVVINMIAQLVIFGDVTGVIMGKEEINLFWVIFLCILQWVLGEANIQMGAANFPPPLYSLGIMEFMNFVCWLAFFGLIYMGRVKYRQQTVGHVNDKYKISVCLRTLAVLKVMAVCSAVRNFICVNVIIALFAWIRPNKDIDGERFASFFYDLTLAIYAALVPFLMIWNHEEMQRTYGRICSPKMESKTEVTTTFTEQKFVARNVVGDVITNPSVQDETRYHFQQLQSNWDTRRLSVQALAEQRKDPMFIKVLHSIQ
ncbi:unnamed protein product [Bursaphelenchus okinawaensis]|uniref:Uncharacterized protein n=1 Tax=Bursaphelenchus okinawaensis TaxID=465554 RepID=A0A811K5J5_9BILA|nr:unnamed protein product [Bursaphelenchus okinawaensis]CAG9091832.1 unnamed protein product [Bursaphelenchus okinawaensis]